jgi:inorganic pyrophosphatase
MGLGLVNAGNKVPDDINVIIEIPAHSEPIKYEVDKSSGALFVDRFLSTAMHYPCDYGYMPMTLSEDGDPVDVLVITPVPVNRGCVLRCRPIGQLAMTDEAGDDQKILAVPIQKLTSLYDHVHKPEDLPPLLLKQIAHFFEHYKDLEEGKWVKLNGWQGPEAAKKEILDSLQRFQAKK